MNDGIENIISYAVFNKRNPAHLTPTIIEYLFSCASMQSEMNDLRSICVKSEQCYEWVLSLDQETLRWALNSQSMKDELSACFLWILLNFFLKRKFNSIEDD